MFEELENMQKAINELQAKVDKMKESKESKRWRAKNGEPYYISSHLLLPVEIIEQNSSKDDDFYENGNYFKTQKEAEQERRLRSFEQRVSARFRDFGQGEFVVQISYVLSVDVKGSRVFSTPCGDFFDSQRGWHSTDKLITDQIIKEFGAENFLKWAKGEL